MVQDGGLLQVQRELQLSQFIISLVRRLPQSASNERPCVYMTCRVFSACVSGMIFASCLIWHSLRTYLSLRKFSDRRQRARAKVPFSHVLRCVVAVLSFDDVRVYHIERHSRGIRLRSGVRFAARPPQVCDVWGLLCSGSVRQSRVSGNPRQRTAKLDAARPLIRLHLPYDVRQSRFC